MKFFCYAEYSYPLSFKKRPPPPPHLSGNQLQECRFSGAVRSNQSDFGVQIDAEIDIFVDERFTGRITEADVLYHDDGGRQGAAVREVEGQRAIRSDTRCKTSIDHLLQRFLLRLRLAGQFLRAVTKASDIILQGIESRLLAKMADFVFLLQIKTTSNMLEQ